jgi:glycosyltransferase involved in cell wall biosynthesis
MLVDFCLPIKNEEKILCLNLERLLEYCRQANFSFKWRIVGVVNGSNDGSAGILAEFKRKFPGEIDYFERSQAGRGGALKKYWSLSRADIFAYMDADLAVSLDNLGDLIDPIIKQFGDVAIGSRLVRGADIKRSLFRELVSQSYNFISHLMIPYQAADLQCGFKAVRADVFRSLEPWLKDDYWFFDTELVVLAQHFGYRVVEVPVNWQENRYGKRVSTVKVFKDSWNFLKDLWNFRRRLVDIRKHLDNV